MQGVLNARNSKYGRHLSSILATYEQVDESALRKQVVRLNSEVELWHEILQKKVRFKVVLPADMDLKKRRLSVFAPVCLAILGRAEGEIVETNRAGINKKYKILRVKNDQ